MAQSGPDEREDAMATTKHRLARIDKKYGIVREA